MSLWTRITDALSALAQGESLSAVFERLRTPPEKSVAFAIAVIALGAKMAKADGRVTRDEVTAFREVFQIARADEAGAARVFDMARTDVAGYQDYARKIKGMFAEDSTVLCDLMEGLFHIAMADGFYHPGENEFLAEVAQIFGQTDRQFHALRARFVPDAPKDPYTVLGVSPDMPMAEIRKVWRKLVRETHPDAMMARGVPEEAIRLAEKKMIDINRAWDELNGARV
ncbi:molecular chaperone DjiA [Ruegeria pomeroyi]|uniref:Molecular chaperone DjiA n=1 Tax=Ruegeria alba TaxID=2916756 RepID=A0ABS9NY79_9RHOB|nr:molecular chaperone DjiA [Ruegeria alba]MCE8513942.1 molecular chaperone DjiA [Ruegeria pomeroyi]MCE8516212.1 molecular chaperone DjiA [Ruegeria pomeroyi]MCE8522632.1 molecular chaperone DjiA [Ruegeria pomeroyi]MCE8527070.1 molecular chaperone DjiA [Ruegeria pomeroyi]MCE8530479.1 molecular chaperone DjiA [Ruegeria pomeroyi]